MLELLKDSAKKFLENPLREAVYAILLALSAVILLPFGPAALLYLGHHGKSQMPQMPAGMADNPALKAFLISQRLRGNRMASAFFIGIPLAFCFHMLPIEPLLGLILWLLLTHLLWLAIILADRFDLTLMVALKASYHFLVDSPNAALPALGLSILSFSGLLFFGIGLFATHPIATRALLAYLDTLPAELGRAVQKAY